MESIQGRRFGPAGTPSGSQFQINDQAPPSSQSDPHVGMDDDGNFVVSWRSYGFSVGNDFSSFSVQAKRFDSNGFKIGSQFQVNTTSGNHSGPRLAAGPNETFVVVWEHIPTQGMKDVLGQKFLFPQAVIFLDGFESGDTSAWSSTQ